MGLDCSHDAWHGPYSAFNRLRQAVCKAIGGSFPPHADKSLDDNYWYSGEGYRAETHPGLYEFLSHSDCDGKITPKMCAKVANELEALLPKMTKMRADLRAFIDGCRKAAAANEPLTFG